MNILRTVSTNCLFRSLAPGKQIKLSCAANGNARIFSSKPYYSIDGKESPEKTPTLNEKFVTKMPPSVQPYLKLARVQAPIGYWLIFMPSACGIALATAPNNLPSLGLLGLCGIGAVLMRAAGCTVNDMWDKDFDKKVKRTKSRPLASNEISTFQAFIFLGGLLSGAVCTLPFLNNYSICVAISALPLVATYPLFKRITYWPQMVLAPTLNWGVLVGYSAVAGCLHWSICLPLFASLAIHTVIFDTIYAHQDKEDDALIGVKSTALLFGDKTKTWLTGFTGAMAYGLYLVGENSQATSFYYVGAAAFVIHILRQIIAVKLSNPDSCLETFKSNKTAQILLFSTIVIDKLLQGIE